LADQIPETQKGGFHGGIKLSFGTSYFGVLEFLRIRDQDIIEEKN
jgi:hypothetical protein